MYINLVRHKLKYKFRSDFGMSTQYMYFNSMEEPPRAESFSQRISRDLHGFLPQAATELLLTKPLAKGSFPGATCK